jgi:5'-nucleotidase
MRILLTNDDGVNATGLKVLERIARKFSDDIWIVAPTEEQSGAGHSLTLTQPVRLRRLGERRFCVTGTPTDSVMMAIAHIMKDQRPDLVSPASTAARILARTSPIRAPSRQRWKGRSRASPRSP